MAITVKAADILRDADDFGKLKPYLLRWVRFDPQMGNQLFHPLWYSVIGPLLPHHINAGVAAKWEALKDSWREQKWDSVIGLHERPYRMEVLRKLYDTGRIDQDKMRELLVGWWVDTEIPQGNQDDPLYLFREAEFSTDDAEGFEQLPDELTLYRGVDGVCELTPDGPSWTTSYKTACFFGGRYAVGTVYKIVVPKSEALAWLVGRGEAEIILDFGRVSDSSQIVEVGLQ